MTPLEGVSQSAMSLRLTGISSSPSALSLDVSQKTYMISGVTLLMAVQSLALRPRLGGDAIERIAHILADIGVN